MKIFRTTSLLLAATLGLAFISGCSGAARSSTQTSPTANSGPGELAHRQGVLIIQAPPGSVVQVQQIKHEFWFGAAIANDAFDGEMTPDDVSKYKEVFLENFNSAVTENALKWQVMQPEREAIDYAAVDAILEWTDANEIPLRGHNIFWGIPKFVQPWVKALDDEALAAALEERATDIATRYRGRFAHYDLNNEMIHGNFYADRLGDSITLEMATWVKDKDPEAKLFLNDYNILTGNFLDEFLVHIRTLLDDGVPLSGIGVQGHLHADSFDPKVLQSALDQLAEFGLPIIVTEFNFPGQRSKFHKEKGRHTITAEEEVAKARAIEDYYRICFSHPAVDGILMWGFWGGANWIPESSLYRQDWSSTPALEVYQDLVYGKWWTSEDVTIGESGQIEVPTFFGRHEVTLDGETTVVDLRKADGSADVNLH